MELEHRQRIVYWTFFVHEQWQMYMAATTNGLCYVGSMDQSYEDLERWVKSRLPDCSFVRDEEQLRPYTSQFEEYFQGRRTDFSVPIDYYGSPFHLSVWNALSDIAYGHTHTYSDIAQRIERPDSARAVGAAIGANPVLIVVPCHRVIGKNGKLTGYRGGLEMKAGLLQLERDYSLLVGGIV